MEKEGWLRRHSQEPPRAMEQKITFKELGSFPEIFLVPRFETIDNIFPVGNFYKSVIAMCFTFGVRVCIQRLHQCINLLRDQASGARETIPEESQFLYWYLIYMIRS